MKTVREQVHIDPELRAELTRAGLSRAMFADIETTGLSREKNRVYLIGILAVADGDAVLTQWLSQSRGEEAAVLRAFADTLASLSLPVRTICDLEDTASSPAAASGADTADPPECAEEPAKPSWTIVTFNGDAFDLPFLAERARLCGVRLPLASFSSLDLYKITKRLRPLLGLADCRQKSLERFLGLEREDRMSGGELIGVYHDYESFGGASREHLLLLHNREDVLGMPALLPVLRYSAMRSASFSNISARESTYTDYYGASCRELYVQAVSSLPLPRPVRIRRGDFFLNWIAGDVFLRVPLREGEARYFFEDYRNYFYLPAEDMAVHKSVGAFVEPSHRVKATRETCYVRKSGTFYPAPQEAVSGKKKHAAAEGPLSGQPVYAGPGADQFSFLLTEEILQDDAWWNEYLRALLAILAPA